MALAIVAGGFWLRSYLYTPLPVSADGYRLEVPVGASLVGVAQQLAADGIISVPGVLALYGRLSGQASRIKAGEYAFEYRAHRACPAGQARGGSRPAAQLHAGGRLDRRWKRVAALHKSPAIRQDARDR
jgi:cell division protein YceG involved in septum cleavage